jgi:hypothetical protein
VTKAATTKGTKAPTKTQAKANPAQGTAVQDQAFLMKGNRRKPRAFLMKGNTVPTTGTDPAPSP